MKPPHPLTTRHVARESGHCLPCGASGDESEVENAWKVVQVLIMTSYATTLDAVDRLSLEEQEDLAATLRRRIAEKRRAELFAAVKEARTEFAKGSCKPASVRAIMQRVRS